MMHASSNCRYREGFSLLEVVIAMGILSFGLLTLALMQMQALTQGAAGRHTGDASAVARSYLEQVHRIPWSVLSTAAGNGWQDPGWAAAPATVNTAVTDPGGGTSSEHSYAVQWRVTNVNTCLNDVEVRVNWAEEDVAGGKQLVLATRRYNWGGASC
jgi:prepilin-type N-terminal cleavage/methylation domain-containing protein